MEQAILRSEQDNGDAGDWTKDGGSHGDIKDEEGNYDFPANAQVIEKYVNTYLKPYISIVNFGVYDKETINDSLAEAYMDFKDGSRVYLHNGSCMNFNYDVNGVNLPNKFGQDRFRYCICKCENYSQGHCGKFKPITIRNTRAEALELCKEEPKNCSQLLLFDNNEFKDDYPYKL